MLSAGSSQPLSTFVRRAPEHGSPGWPPYRRSLVGHALLSLLPSPTMFVAVTPPRVLPTFTLVFCYWYDHIHLHLNHGVTL
jgi:hypothetical protein